MRKAPAPTPSDAGPSTNDEYLSIFSRRKEMETVIERDRRKRLQKKERREQKQVEERRRSSEKRSASAALDTSEPGEEVLEAEKPSTPSKRTRTGPPSTPQTKTPSRRQHTATPVKREVLRSGSHRSTPRRPAEAVAQEAMGRDAEVIPLDSDDGDEPFKTPFKTRKADLEVAKEPIAILDDSDPEPAPQEDPAEELDEFCASFVRKAEEEAKARAQGVQQSPIIAVCISSPVPGTKAIRMRMRLDDPLSKVRRAWATRQYDNDVAVGDERDLVLVWRGHMAYASSSFRALGVRPSPWGHGFTTDHNDRAALTEDGAGVLLEIFTSDLWEKFEADRKREQQLRDTAGDDSLNQSGFGADHDVELEPEVKLKVILKAKDLDSVKLTVRPETTVETLINGFKHERDVSGQVTLWFDGECLDESMTVEDAEIEDMDSIEVHIQ